MNFEPGREMDALVAEKVMGCKLESHVNPKYSPTCGCSNHAHRNDDEQVFDLLKNYSTDIAAAFEVLSHIKKNWRFSQRMNFHDALAYQLKGFSWPYAILLLEPVHICRAALAAADLNPVSRIPDPESRPTNP